MMITTTKQIDWNTKSAYAKKLSIAELQFAINDCVETSKCGLDTGYYCDEASIYRTELNNRLKGVK